MITDEIMHVLQKWRLVDYRNEPTIKATTLNLMAITISNTHI